MLSTSVVYPQHLPATKHGLRFTGTLKVAAEYHCLIFPKALPVPTEIDLLNAERPPENPVPDWLLTGVDLTALAYAACEALSLNELPIITYEAEGGYNRLFLLSFEKAHKSALARVASKKAHSRFYIPSIVATMSFARYIRKIPTPEIYAWNGAASNPVGAPYIIQEYVSDVVEPWEVFHKGSEAQRTLIISELARCHAEFLTPLPTTLQGIGRILFSPNLPPSPDLSDPQTYILEPLSVNLSPPWEEMPRMSSLTTTSIEGFWDELYVLRKSMAQPNSQSIDLDEIDLDEAKATIEACNPASFAAAASHARNYIRHSLSLLQQAPADLSTPCLFRNDYAFRNVLLDAKTLQIRAFIDWDDVCVKPFILAINFPEDISSFSQGGLDPHSTYFRDGAFGMLPPEEDGEILSIHDEQGTYRDVDEHGNPTYIDDRNERIRNTAYRREYVDQLKRYEDRIGRRGTWELRKDLMRAEYLVSRGGEAWWDKREWLKRQNETSLPR